MLADRGLWSPRLWKRVRDLGWHPLLRIQRRTTVAPDGRERCRAEALVRPGEAWVGRGHLGSPKSRRLGVTLVAVWMPGQEEPWVVVTDLPPEQVGVSWYALRAWVDEAVRRLDHPTLQVRVEAVQALREVAGDFPILRAEIRELLAARLRERGAACRDRALPPDLREMRRFLHEPEEDVVGSWTPF